MIRPGWGHVLPGAIGRCGFGQVRPLLWRAGGKCERYVGLGGGNVFAEKGATSSSACLLQRCAVDSGPLKRASKSLWGMVGLCNTSMRDLCPAGRGCEQAAGWLQDVPSFGSRGAAGVEPASRDLCFPCMPVYGLAPARRGGTGKLLVSLLCAVGRVTDQVVNVGCHLVFYSCSEFSIHFALAKHLEKCSLLF